MITTTPGTLMRSNLKHPLIDKVYHGKVRDVYTLSDGRILLVASDRISAFDVVLPRGIPHKGQVLSQLSWHMLQATAGVAPNWGNVAFCASSRITKAWSRVRPRMKASGAI